MFLAPRTAHSIFENRVSGGCSERDPPVPIPNTAVKPLSADGTARATVWESRSSPGIDSRKALAQARAFLYSSRTGVRASRTPSARPLGRPEQEHAASPRRQGSDRHRLLERHR